MKHPYGTLASAAIIIAVICSPSRAVVSAQISTKAYALPGAATDPSSVVSNVPNFMVSMAEGGTVPGENKATCDNRADSGSAGFTLQHYFAKDPFEQMAGVLRPISLRRSIQDEAGAAAVVSDTPDGVEAVYYIVTGVCSPDIGTPPVNPTASRIVYQARLFRDTTYATFEVRMSAVGPDIPRKYVREMIQKIGALDYASIK